MTLIYALLEQVTLLVQTIKNQPNQTLKKQSNQFWTEAKFEMFLDKVMSL